MFSTTLPEHIPNNFDGVKVIETGVAFRKAIERGRKGGEQTILLQGFIPFNADMFEMDTIYIDSMLLAELLQVQHKNLLQRIEEEIAEYQSVTQNSAKILAEFKKCQRKTRRGKVDYYKVESTAALQLMASYATPVGRFMGIVLRQYIQALQDWYKATVSFQNKTRAELRKESKEKRNLLTYRLKVLGAQPKDYAAVTNAGYRGAFQKDAQGLKKDIQETLGVKNKNLNIRDYASEMNLGLISNYETLACIRSKEKNASIAEMPSITFSAAEMVKELFEKFLGRPVEFEPTLPDKELNSPKQQSLPDKELDFPEQQSLLDKESDSPGKQLPLF